MIQNSESQTLQSPLNMHRERYRTTRVEGTYISRDRGHAGVVSGNTKNISYDLVTFIEYILSESVWDHQEALLTPGILPCRAFSLNWN